MDDGVDQVIGGNPPASNTSGLVMSTIEVLLDNLSVINFGRTGVGDDPVAGSNCSADYDYYVGRKDMRNAKMLAGIELAVLGDGLEEKAASLLKGNKPLELRYHKCHRVVLYASDSAYLDAVLEGERGWVEIPLPPMSLLVFRHDDLSGYSREIFTFKAQTGRPIGTIGGVQ